MATRNWNPFAKALLCLAAVLAAERAFAIAYWGHPDNPDSDYAIVEADPNKEPANLLNPGSDLTATVFRPSGSFAGSGAVIASNWIVSAAHVLDDAYAPGADPSQMTFTIDGTTYKPALDPITSEPMIRLHPDWSVVSGSGPTDLGLVRIVNVNGADANLSHWSTIATIVPTASVITIGGYGERRYVNEETGTVSDSLGSAQLRWGRNIAMLSDTNQIVGFDKPELAPSIPNVNYVKYEGQPRPGDSGSGWFFRDGWESRLSAVTRSVPAVTFGLGDTTGTGTFRAEVLDWFESTMGSEFQIPSSPNPKPTATINWIGSSSGDWNTSSNWQDVITGTMRLPRFDTEVADVVNITQVNGPVIASDTAPAQDVFVGRITSTQLPAKLRVESAGQLNVDSIFVGAEDGEFGELQLNNGTVNAVSEFVGVRGRGNIVQSGGSNSVTTLHVGYDNSSAMTMSEYRINGTSTVSDQPKTFAAIITIGTKTGSSGLFRMWGGPHALTASNMTIVGDRGEGTFDHQIGVHEVRGDLILGQYAGSTGTYALFNDAVLTTNNTFVGRDGTGVFYHLGGTHSLDKLQVDTQAVYYFEGGVLEARAITGEIEFAPGTARVVASGLADFSGAEFSNAQNATLEIAADSLALLPGPNSFASTIQQGALTPHVVGSGTLQISGGGFRGYGNITDPVAVLGNGYITVAPGPVVNGPVQSLNVSSLTMADSALITIEKNAVLSATPLDGASLAVVSGNPSISIEGGELRIFQSAFTGAGFQVNNEGHLTIDMPQNGQVQLQQTDALVEAGGRLSANGDIQFIVGQRTFFMNGILEVGPGIGLLKFRDAPPIPNSDIHLLLDTTSTIEIELGEQGYDQLFVVGGQITLNGQLGLARVNEFVPTIGDQFDIIRADNFISGVFANLSGSVIDFGTTETQDDIGLAVVYLHDDAQNQDIVRVRASLLGDADLNNHVFHEDLSRVQNNFGMTNATWEMGDFTGNGVVDLEDFNIVQNNFGQQWPPEGSGGGGGVPEPATLGLFGLAMVGLVGLIRRRG